MSNNNTKSIEEIIHNGIVDDIPTNEIVSEIRKQIEALDRYDVDIFEQVCGEVVELEDILNLFKGAEA